MEEQPASFLPRPIHAIVIGAGISAIQFVRDAKTRLKNVKISVYDKNHEEGGTWTENRYPGCACDIASHTYQFSWNPNPTWTKVNAPAPEILRYLKATVRTFDLQDSFNFNTRCVKAEWDEDTSQWNVVLRMETAPYTEFTETCDVFVSAVGRSNNWKMPDIAGLDQFGGRVVHTANWPRNLDYKGKRIAIIGNGASALQCLAGMCKDAGSIDNFIRSPTWLIPHIFAPVDYTKETIKKFRQEPRAYFEHRLQLEKNMIKVINILWRNTDVAKKHTDTARQRMAAHMKDASALHSLLPAWKVGCRSFTSSDAYLEALNQANIALIRSPIMRADQESLYTADGHQKEYDIIVCATGFDSFTPRFPIIGRDGRNLEDLWSGDNGYESYMAATVAGFPNFFIFNPPVCPISGSAFPGIERASDYMMRVISRLQKDGLKSVSVKDTAQAAFGRWAQSRMPHMVWSEDCSASNKSKTGKVIGPWPGTILHYYEATEFVRWEDYDLKFLDEGQKYASFGNGVTVDGFDPESFPWLRL